jgi:hypothetical protein
VPAVRAVPATLHALSTARATHPAAARARRSGWRGISSSLPPSPPLPSPMEKEKARESQRFGCDVVTPDGGPTDDAGVSARNSRRRPVGPARASWSRRSPLVRAGAQTGRRAASWARVTCAPVATAVSLSMRMPRQSANWPVETEDVRQGREGFGHQHRD